MNYLLENYKGKYRLKTHFDEINNCFQRDYNGKLSDLDIYISCYNSVEIQAFGGRGKAKILQAYFPSHTRGRKVVNSIIEELGDNVIFEVQDYDKELEFKFYAYDMERLEPYLAPKTNGANISPFSTKNLNRAKLAIPEDMLEHYREATMIVQGQMSIIKRVTQNYLTTLTNKKYKADELKADIRKSGLKNKEYIYSIGKFEDYINYMKRNLPTLM